jgi:O-antigen/teichoic acid export membrane protein
MKTFLLETRELLLSQWVIAILAIIQVRIVAGNLGPEIYGNIGVYLGFVGISFRLLSSRNSDLILMNYKSTTKNFLISSLLFELTMGSFSVLFVFGIFYLYYGFIPEYLFLYFFTRIFLNFLEVFKGVFTHNGNMKIYSYVESSSSIARFILIVLFISVNPSISSYFYALSFYQIFVAALVLTLLLTNNNNGGLKMNFKDYLNLSKKSFLKIRTDQAVGLIPIHLDIVVIGYFSNYYSAGVYRIAKKLVEPVNSLIVAFSPWMLSKIDRKNDYNFGDLTLKILIPSSVFISIAYLFFGKKLIDIIAGPEFSDSYIPMLILVVGYIAYYLTFWTRHYLLLNGLILKHTKGRVVNLLVFLIASPLLIPRYGFNGIAMSISLSIVFQKLYEINAYYKNKNIKHNN